MTPAGSDGGLAVASGGEPVAAPPRGAAGFVMPLAIALKETVFDCVPLCVVAMQAPDSQLNAPDASRIARDILRRTVRDKTYEVVYRQPSFKRVGSETHIGRFYPRNVDFACYQSMQGSLRRLAVAGRYVEVDMKNAHPTILFSVVGDPVFGRYIERRDEMLDAVQVACGVKRWAAKNLFIRLNYGGEVGTWMREHGVAADPPGAAEYEDAVRRFVRGPFTSAPEYSVYHAFARANRKKREGFSALAYFLQTLEARAVACAIERLAARGVTARSLIHDGILVDAAVAPGIDLAGLGAEVSALSGVACAFDVKPLECDEEDAAFYATALEHTTYRPASAAAPGAVAESPLSKAVRRAVSGTHADVAALFHHMFPGGFAYLGKTGWFEFTAPCWVSRDNEPLEIPRRLNNEVLAAVEAEMGRAKALISAMRADPANTGDCVALAELAKGLEGLSLKLRDSRFKQYVVKELTILYGVPKPLKWLGDLDSKSKHLVALEDAVIDLSAGGALREGRPEDMLRFSVDFTRAEFEAPPDQERLAVILEAIRSTQPNEACFEYILDVLAYSLHGDRPLDNFWIWSGTGANGKGLVKELVEATFGDLAYFPDPQLFMARSVRGGVLSPELVKMVGKRIVMCSESEHGDDIRVGLIKQATGGDRIQARGCYEKAVEFKITANIIFLFNAVPAIEDSSGGIARRLRFVDFPFKFVEEPSGPLDKRLDTSLRGRFGEREFGLAFLQFLVARFNREGGGLKFPTPPEVVLSGQRFLQQCDNLQQFLDECYERTGRYEHHVSLKEMLCIITGPAHCREFRGLTTTQSLSQKLQMKGLALSKINGRTRVHGFKSRLLPLPPGFLRPDGEEEE